MIEIAYPRRFLLACASVVVMMLLAKHGLGQDKDSGNDDVVVGDIVNQADAHGDASRGAEVFFSKEANCQGCHRVLGYGGMVGPNLSKVGSQRSPQELVESLLWPARKVADKYRLTTVVTDEGKSIQGYLQHETNRRLKLKDPATGQMLSINVGSIEDRIDGGSLMPDGLLSRLKPQQVHDLVHFLTRLTNDSAGEIPLPKSLTDVPESVAPKGFETVDVEIELGTIHEQMRFDKHWIRALPKQKVKLTLKNTDRMQHNLLICDPFAKDIENTDVASQVAKLSFALGADAVGKNYVPDTPLVLWNTPIVNPGTSAAIYFVAPDREGDYPIVCTLPGHAMRMRSILHIGNGEAPPVPEKTVEEIPKSGIERANRAMQQYWQLSNLAPVFSGVIDMQKSVSESTNGTVDLKTPTHKGIAVRTGDAQDGAVLFDADLLRFSGAWSGSFIELREGREDERAEYRSSVGGKMVYYNTPGPGWDQPEEWQDSRSRKLGPLPKDWAKYRGQYRYGDRVIFDYTVGEMRVLDHPWSEPLTPDDVMFTRTLQCESATKAHRVTLAEVSSELQKETLVGVDIATFDLGEGECLAFSLVAGQPQKLTFQKSNSRCELLVRAHETPLSFRLHVWRGRRSELEMFASQVAKRAEVADLKKFITGGLAQWSETVITHGEVSTSTEPFVVDTLRLPFENPWNCLLYTSGLDFFDNGDAALCTSHGDVWTVGGIDEGLSRLTWRRIASGLSNPLGLKIVDDTIYVTCLDQIVRLHDLNGDQEIDYYECFNNDCQVSHQHHRFATGLETDSAGNFYYCKCSEEGGTDHGGSLVRVSKDGSKFEIVATGLRNPNGLSIGPNDTITFGKQQGGWIPSSGIHTVKPGGFYGYMPSHHRETPPDRFENPLCWIPHGIDNSCGGQVWVSAESKWNSLADQLLHLSYGKCEMFLVLQETVDGESQGGVVKLPGVAFQSGAMRARFRPQDGQLYVTGLRGWQTSAEWAGCLQRVRYQGPDPRLPIGLHVKKNGIKLTFSSPLDAKRARDISHYRVRRWNYQWTKTYGSKDYSVANPDKEGRDEVEIKGVVLSPDQRSVFIEMPDVTPAMQMMIEYDLNTADGKPIAGPIFNTVNRVPN